MVDNGDHQWQVPVFLWTECTTRVSTSSTLYSVLGAVATISAMSLAVQIYAVHTSKIYSEQQCSWVGWLPSVTCALSRRQGRAGTRHQNSPFSFSSSLFFSIHLSILHIFLILHFIFIFIVFPFPFTQLLLSNRVWNPWFFPGNQRKHLDRAAHTPSIPALMRF